MSLKHEISFTINDEPVTVQTPVHLSALNMIRDVLKLKGTKYSCGEGECGACTILVDGHAVNSCMMFAVDCDGRDILTVEGVQNETGISRLQKEFVEQGATQCGFCTPGMILQGTYLLRKNPNMTFEDVKIGLEGNLCRCTGYKKIIDAVLAAAKAEQVS
jgi:aerobic carbon-monoxide dehydrogenase small subunit